MIAMAYLMNEEGNQEDALKMFSLALKEDSMEEVANALIETNKNTKTHYEAVAALEDEMEESLEDEDDDELLVDDEDEDEEMLVDDEDEDEEMLVDDEDDDLEVDDDEDVYIPESEVDIEEASFRKRRNRGYL
jgi:hypothetical protein